jgi:hypothetical protein
VETDRTALIPQAAADLVDRASRALNLVSKTGERVVVSLRNTLLMRHEAVASNEEILVLLDWALLERVLMLGHFFWGMNGSRLWSQRITGFLEQEVFLAGSRAAALQGQFALAANMQAAYENFEFRDRIEHRLDVEEQAQEFSWYVIFATFRELGRLIVNENLEEARESVREMAPGISPAELADDRLVRELYLDNAGINAVARTANSISRSALAELILYVTIDELHRKAGIVGLSAGGYSGEFEFALRAARSDDHQLRFNLLYSRCHNHAEEFEDPAIARKVRSGAEMADKFQIFMEQALDYGLPKLRECDAMHMRMYGREDLEDDYIDNERKHEIQRSILAFTD